MKTIVIEMTIARTTNLNSYLSKISLREKPNIQILNIGII